MTIPVTELRKVTYHYREDPTFWRGWRSAMHTARRDRMSSAHLRKEVLRLTQQATRMMGQPMSNLARSNVLYLAGEVEGYSDRMAELECEQWRPTGYLTDKTERREA